MVTHEIYNRKLRGSGHKQKATRTLKYRAITFYNSYLVICDVFLSYQNKLHLQRESINAASPGILIRSLSRWTRRNPAAAGGGRP